MTSFFALLSLVLVNSAESVEPAHGANTIYQALIEKGLEIDGHHVRFPAPLLKDGQSGEQQLDLLRGLLESDRKVAEFIRDSVTAPHVLKVKDESTPTTLIRRVDLWFAVHADLDQIKPDSFTQQANDSKPVEVGNMRFESQVIPAEALQAKGINSQKTTGATELFVHQTGRLLDRIHVEGTDQVLATQSAKSWILAARTDRRFDEDAKWPNRWWPIQRRDGRDVAGTAQNFPGGASYVVINQLASDPKVLIAEAHFVFAEPRLWFDGAPILRSKFSLIAQDQIRRLRREVAKIRSRPAANRP